MGLFDTKQKNGPKAESWSISTKNGLPIFFEKNGREWFDADKTWASPTGAYYIHTGMDANSNEGIAITTKNKGLRIKRTEDFVETALITDDGLGYALTDEGILHILAEDSTSQRKLCEDYSPNAYTLTPEICAVVYDTDSDDEDLEAIYLKVLDLKSLKSWKKKIKYRIEKPSTLNYKIELVGDIIKVTTPDNIIHEFARNN